MRTTIVIRRFSGSFLLRLLAIGFGVSGMIFAVVNGLLALFGAKTVNWNGHAITGSWGLIASPFIGLFVFALFTLFAWIPFALSFWIYSKCRPLTVEYFSIDSGNAPPSIISNDPR